MELRPPKRKANFGLPRKLRNALRIALVILSIIFIGKMMGIWNISINRNQANEPNIKNGQFLIYSSLFTPKQFDFIVFDVSKNIQNTELQRTSWMSRIVGMSGDTIQIKSGVLYINGKLPSKQFETLLDYTANEDDATIVIKSTGIPVWRYDYKNDSETIVTLSESERKNVPINLNLHHKSSYMIMETYMEQWTDLDFGPVVVPEKSVFVMGDNRSQSLDSRYFGMIALEDIQGKVLFR